MDFIVIRHVPGNTNNFIPYDYSKSISPTFLRAGSMPFPDSSEETPLKFIYIFFRKLNGIFSHLAASIKLHLFFRRINDSIGVKLGCRYLCQNFKRKTIFKPFVIKLLTNIKLNLTSILFQLKEFFVLVSLPPV